MRLGAGGDRIDPVSGAHPEQVVFGDLYRERFQSIYAYVVRRAAMADAADLVADVFATAWRRKEDVPRPPEDRLWLFGVARRIVSQNRRSTSRRKRLTAKLQRNVIPAAPQGPERSDLEERLFTLIDRLRADDRELVTLIVWDGLTHAEVATVLGCSTNAVGIRWHRALNRLRSDLSEPTDRTQSNFTLTRTLSEET